MKCFRKGKISPGLAGQVGLKCGEKVKSSVLDTANTILEYENIPSRRKKVILYCRSFKCLEFRFCPVDNGRPTEGFSFYIFLLVFFFYLPPCFCLVSIWLVILTACFQIFFFLIFPPPCILPPNCYFNYFFCLCILTLAVFCFTSTLGFT